MKNQGFSLIELLAVIALIGILGGIGFNSWLGASNRARVRDAATQITADLQRARSGTLRYNLDSSFVRTSATVYTVSVNGQSSSRTLPQGTQFEFDAGAGPVGYIAPFAELDAASTASPPRLKVSLTGNANVPAVYIKLIGVTGKVILSATP